MAVEAEIVTVEKHSIETQLCNDDSVIESDVV